MTPLFTNDAVAFGILMLVLALVFVTSSSDKMPWKGFYRFVPPILLCYFIPALLNYPFGIIAPHWFTEDLFPFLITKGLNPEALGLSSMSFDAITTVLKNNGITETEYAAFTGHSSLYFVASRYLLPASLILLCLSIDFKGLVNLGNKALIMFFAATVGIIIGGPIAVLIVLNVFPDLIPMDNDQLWRSLSTVAGSWIGGGANQTAMKEIFEVPDNLFGSMIVVDVICANIWMGFLLYGANISTKMDKWLKADASMIEDLKNRVEDYRASVERIPTSKDLYVLGAVAFGGVALAHFGADLILPLMEQFKATLVKFRLNSLLSGFFWLIVIATTVGLVMSFTKLRSLDGVGASRWGGIFIYILVATIGMKMNLGEIFQNLGLFAIGIIWMLVHVTVLLITAKIIRAPFFFVAVGSQANVGGAASAPVVAAAFSPALASVGALMAVLGYALGTYGAIACAYLMQWVSG
jgi:uncharacterized membrane protein